MEWRDELAHLFRAGKAKKLHYNTRLWLGKRWVKQGLRNGGFNRFVVGLWEGQLYKQCDFIMYKIKKKQKKTFRHFHAWIAGKFMHNVHVELHNWYMYTER